MVPGRSGLSADTRASRQDPSTGAAYFDPYVWRNHTGQIRFENRLPNTGRFRDRCWPVFQRVPRKRWRKLPPYGPAIRVSRAIARASKIAAARRWLPCNPLFVHVMTVEDARKR
jgi:hypothetical protein